MDKALDAVTKGSLKTITEGNHLVDPILQCVQIKIMTQGQNGTERWRVVFNDSVNFIQGMLATQMNHLVNDEKLKKGSICRLTQYQSNFVKDKHILVVLALDVLEEYGEVEKLGLPVALETKPEPSAETKPQPGSISGNNFYGNKPAEQQQPQRSLPSHTNRASHGSSHGTIHPIESLSPYGHKWTIKARCSQKGDIKTWHNKNGQGKLFSANFLDESGEIRATGFNEQVDQFYDILQEGNVYYISNPCRVQPAKKQFSNVNNDYELTFERDTLIEKAEDMDGVPQVRYNFATLHDLQTIEKDTLIDVIGVLQEVGETSEIVGKASGKPYSKRELTLVDNSGFNVRLTIWGKTAESFDASLESVVAFKGVKVSDFGGRSLSLLASGTMSVNPDIEEAYKLKGWYDGTGRTEKFQSHANTMSAANATGGNDRNATKTIAQVRDENLGMGDDTDWFSIKATIIYVYSDKFSYPACQNQTCNKKVVEDQGQWRCEKCDKAWDAPDYRYTLGINVSDHTGQIRLSCFNDTGVAIMGVTANEVMTIREEGDDRRVHSLFEDATCKTYNFRCKARMDNFQDQARVRYQVQYANALDFARESKKLTDIIQMYNKESDSLFVQ